MFVSAQRWLENSWWACVCNRLFTVRADKAVLGSKGVEELTAEGGLMQHLRQRIKIKIQCKKSERTCMLVFVYPLQCGIELLFKCLNIGKKRLGGRWCMRWVWVWKGHSLKNGISESRGQQRTACPNMLCIDPCAWCWGTTLRLIKLMGLLLTSSRW